MNTEQPRPTRRAKLRSFALNAALMLGVFIAATAFKTRNMLPADAETAPELRGITLSDGAYDLRDAAGRPALVYFFAPWCRICGASADNLARLRRWRDADSFEIVAVALDWSSVEEVRDYVDQHELGVPVLLGDREVRDRWQIYAYPSYYVLDSKHGIARRDIGYSSQFGLWWRAWTVR